MREKERGSQHPLLQPAGARHPGRLRPWPHCGEKAVPGPQGMRSGPGLCSHKAALFISQNTYLHGPEHRKPDLHVLKVHHHPPTMPDRAPELVPESFWLLPKSLTPLGSQGVCYY